MNTGEGFSEEFRVLLEALLEGQLSDAQQMRLNELLADDPETRRAYVQYMTTLAGVRRYLKGRPAFLDGVNEASAEELAAESKATGPAPSHSIIPAVAPIIPADNPLGNSETQPPAVLGFIGNCFRWGGDFLSRPTGIFVALAIGIVAAAAFVLGPASFRPENNRDGKQLASAAASSDEEPIFIARITDSHSAKWELGGELPVGKSLLSVGQRLSLTSGLVEISFDNGARVLLEGPAELVLDSPVHATLAHGQLTAEIPEQAVGFTVQTPVVDVVDLGTKFGVRVSPKGMTDVAVFSGEVVASRHNAATESEQAIRVLADEVRRFWNGSTVDEEPLAPPDFTLAIPKRVPIENASFELPRIGGWLSREIGGWKIASQPAWIGQPNGGVQLASAERVQLPEPAHGQQWAFLESCKLPGGGPCRTSMYQAVAKLAPNTDYTLRVTIGREGFVPAVGEDLCYPFSGFDGVEIGLWSGSDKSGEPIEPLRTVRDPLRLVGARSSGVATLTYRSPAELPPGEQWLFIRLGVAANDWCRALFDDVQLEAVPVDGQQVIANLP